MKNESVRKINTIGNVGYVLSTIMKVFLIIGIVGTIVATVFFAVIPSDLFSVSVGGDMTAKLDLSRYAEFDKEDVDDFLGKMQDNNISVNEFDYSVASVEVNDSVITATAKSSNVTTVTPRSLLGVMISSLLYLAASLVTVWFICSLCKAFKTCESPFEENVVRKIKNFAFSLIPWAVIASLTESVSKSFYTGKLDIEIGVNLGTVVVILVVFALAFIFNYGAKLQKESDETL